MNRTTVVKLTASSLVLAGTAIGCTPQASRPMAISSVAPKGEAAAAARSARLADAASRALAKGKPALAVTRAEQAVAFAPHDAARRVLLGRAYLAVGRFVSAGTALGDALVLDPGNGGALMNLSLAQIALGDWSGARQTLANAQGRVAEADRGLGLALAGRIDDAITVLEFAARAPGATSTARQNLALTYALAGRWAESRAVAAQDVSPADLDGRMAEWARFAQPTAVWSQVATLLKVTPARDTGLPAALALAPSAMPVRAAAAAPVAPPLPVDAAAPPVEAAALPVAPVAAAAATIPATIAPVAMGVEMAATPPAAVPVPVAAGPVEAVAAAPVFTTPPSAPRDAPLLHARRAPTRSAFLYRTRPPAAPVLSIAQGETGRWAVQLGAYAAPRAMDTAWSKVSGRLGLLAAYTPYRSQKASFRRLAVSGFTTRDQAAALCRRIRARHGDCFVRPVQGDVPVRMAARRPATQVASR